MLKIKVNLDKKNYQTLLNDIKLFNITKKDGSINRNKFMNLLFQNFYTDYILETEAIVSNANKIMKKYNIENNAFAVELAAELLDYKNKSLDTYYNESLTFYLSEENEFIFETLNDFLSHMGASAYFRNLIYKYLTFPQYQREQIIYKHILGPIYQAIQNKCLVKIKLEKVDLIIKPYKIGTSKEEIYSYLLGIVNDTPASIHILKIKAAIMLKNTYSFTEKENQLLSSIYHLGIQFPFKNLCKAEIELTNKGIRLYNAKYLHRPDVIKIVGNHYFFECSFDQLLLYFLSFGKDMKIISPSFLGRSIYKNYKGYVDAYEKEVEEN